MGRALAVLLVVIGFAVPALAEENPDCSIWDIRGIRLGMTPNEAMQTRLFRQFSHAEDPPGYVRYVWESRERPDRIDMHVDTSVVPPRVIGAGTTTFGPETPPEQFLSSRSARWGPPVYQFEEGAHRVHRWRSDPCDVEVGVRVVNRDDKVVFYVAMSSISGRREFARRKREAEAAAGAEADEATDVPTASPEESTPDDASGGGD